MRKCKAHKKAKLRVEKQLKNAMKKENGKNNKNKKRKWWLLK